MSLLPAFGGSSSGSNGGTATLSEPPGLGVRRAAYGGGVPVNGLGPFTEFPWTPGAPPYRVTLRATIASKEAVVGNCQLMGRSDANQLSWRVYADGRIEGVIDGPDLEVSTPAGAFAFDGSEREVAVTFDVTASSATITIAIAGEQVMTGAGSGSFGTPGSNARIGAQFSVADRWPGTMRDVAWEVEGNAAQSVLFPLDDDPLGGTFRNTAEGSTVADATITGLVRSVMVQTTQLAKALPVGRALYLHSASRGATTQAVSGADSASHTLDFESVGVNESGALTASGFTSLGPGLLLLEASGLLTGSTVADTVEVEVQVGGVDSGNQFIDLSVGVDSEYLVTAVEQVPAGTFCRVQLKGVDGANTGLGHSDARLSIEFYPTP